MNIKTWARWVRERAQSKRLFCTHLSPVDIEFWECTHMMRFGKTYNHSPAMISQAEAMEVIKRNQQWPN